MGKDLTKVTNTFFMCNGGTCKKYGSEVVIHELRCAIKMAGLHEHIHTAKTLCLGQCENAPVAFVTPDNLWYKSVTENTIDDLVNDQFKKGKPLTENLLYKNGDSIMHPVKKISSKMMGEMAEHQDPYLGEISGTSIYPWEFNIYPLLKELFEVYHKDLRIWINDVEIQRQKFRIRYEPEKSLIVGQEAKVLKEVVLKAGKDKNLIKEKVSSIKLYHQKTDNIKGLYMANSREGMFLNAQWNNKGTFWDHIAKNYALISG